MLTQQIRISPAVVLFFCQQCNFSRKSGTNNFSYFTHFSWFQIPLLSKNDSTVTIMKDETTPVWRENLSTILCYQNDNNLADKLKVNYLSQGSLWRSVLSVKTSWIYILYVDTLYLRNMPLEGQIWPTWARQLLFTYLKMFPAENLKEVHIIRFVCDVSCLYICIQTNMSEFCPLEYICLNQKTNKKLYNVTDCTDIQLAMEMNISRFSHRDKKKIDLGYTQWRCWRQVEREVVLGKRATRPSEMEVLLKTFGLSKSILPIDISFWSSNTWDHRIPGIIKFLWSLKSILSF